VADAALAAGERPWILHVDLDEFIAAVEIARRPELAGRPVVVGGDGDPTRRGVVGTANYAARAFGVGSGMPLRTAARRCPDAVFLPMDLPAYEAASEVVMTALRGLGLPVEVLGLDEAFVGARTDDPEALAARIRATVEAETGFVCSVGIGDNKLRAKMATGFAKPAGVYRLTRETWMAVMGDRPTDALHGIGRRTATKLAAEGLTTVAQLAAADHRALAARFGPTMGPWYKVLALGAGNAEVRTEPWRAKSRSRETTFQENVADPAALAEVVDGLAARVAEDVREEGRPVARVGVKVRFAPFFTQSRSVGVRPPTGDPDAIAAAARDALAKFSLGRPVRLVGVRAEFVPEPAGGQTS
jgi:DNA polymerase IV